MPTERQFLRAVLVATLLLTCLMIQTQRGANQRLVEQNRELSQSLSESQKLATKLDFLLSERLRNCSVRQPPPAQPPAPLPPPSLPPPPPPCKESLGHVSVPAAKISPMLGVAGSRWFTQCQPQSYLVAVSYAVTLKSVVDPSFSFETIETVMEAQPGTCDVFSRNFCCDLARGNSERHSEAIDAPIVSTILAFLHYCHDQKAQECEAIDIGANMGTMSKYMLSAGARVRAIEPQEDLSTLVWNTACRNGWEARMTTFNNAVTAVATEAGRTLTLGYPSKIGGHADAWGFRPDGSHRAKDGAVRTAQKVYIDEVIGAGSSDIDFVKIDTDSVDDQLMQRFIQLIEGGIVTVSTFTVEEPKAATCWTMQSLGYTLYITVNAHTRFKPSSSWEPGVATEITKTIGGARKFPIHMWKIVPTNEKVMEDVVARTAVLNMVFTKLPEVIGV